MNGLNEYQEAAARTIRKDNSRIEIEYHALHGLSAEVGELHSIYQKVYQGHEAQEDHIKKELGDLLWFIAEFCFARGWELADIAQMNIDKLLARYPSGFSAERSLNRADDDV